ncbi:MAG: triphosphoribosyl-dephospho-CoA synthase [Bacteroidales bacterium]
MEALHKILEAKEKRADLRGAIAKQLMLSVSINLNIAGWPKSNTLISAAYRYLLQDFKRYLLSYRIYIDTNQSILQTDEAGDFFIAPILSCPFNDMELKNIFENFEKTHAVGRLIDVDLVNKKGEPVSSGKIKKCLICKGKAIECMRLKRHTFDEMQEKTTKILTKFFLKKQSEFIASRISSIAVQALIAEVSLSPKAGLVDFNDSGIHNDMDYLSFVRSSTSLQTGFYDIALLAMGNLPLDSEELLPKLRQIGIEMEERMLEVTNGVNTQKGAIFLLGLMVFASTYALYNYKSISPEKIRCILKEINKDLSIKEQIHQGQHIPLTHGQKCIRKYGEQLAGGARLEAELGFPLVFEVAYPCLCEKLNMKEHIAHDDLQKAMNYALLNIMAKNNDTNILFRSSLEILEEFKNRCSEILCSEDEDKKEIKFKEINSFCLSNRISAGGSADLLSLSVFFFFLTQDYNSIQKAILNDFVIGKRSEKQCC